MKADSTIYGKRNLRLGHFKYPEKIALTMKLHRLAPAIHSTELSIVVMN